MAQNSFVSVMWKGSKLLSRQAQPEECALAAAPAQEQELEPSPPWEGCLLLKLLPVGTARGIDHAASVLPSPAQPKRAVPV